MTEAHVHTLPSGLRLLVLPMPHLHSLCASVYVGSGSAAESRRNNGISHLLEHMLFKGTSRRDARGINVDAERLGAELNAHTDRDHTAYHVRGLATHLPQFVELLAELVLAPSLPADELERERQVLLHELTEDEEDPLSTAFKLFDRACFGMHAAALPVIGTRAALQRLQREELLAWHRQQFRPERMVVALAGRVTPDEALREVQRQFSALPASATLDAVQVAPPPWCGGIKARHLAGHAQAHLVLGWPAPPLAADDPTPQLAAALFGEGMSSPLMHELREKRGLFYFAACSADILATQGQFVLEASTTAAQRDEFLQQVLRLVQQQAQALDEDDLQRGRNLLKVRLLRDAERATRALEDAALDLLFIGRVRTLPQRLQRLDALSAEDVRQCFARLLENPLALGASGALGRSASAQLRAAVGAL